MFISRQTHEGSKISIYSVIDLVKFLLNVGVGYVLTNRFCQDPVEQYFGKQRGMWRRSDNPTIYNFGFNDNTIRMQSQTYRSRETQKEQVKSVGVALMIKPCPSVNATSDYLYVKT